MNSEITISTLCQYKKRKRREHSSQFKTLLFTVRNECFNCDSKSIPVKEKFPSLRAWIARKRNFKKSFAYFKVSFSKNHRYIFRSIKLLIWIIMCNKVMKCEFCQSSESVRILLIRPPQKSTKLFLKTRLDRFCQRELEIYLLILRLFESIMASKVSH